MYITDTHTHLYADEFNDDRTGLIKNAISKGVTKFFLPNIDSSSFEGLYKVCSEFPENCFPMMGLHPCSVKQNYLEELAKVENELGNKKFYAIGEIGMDLYWDITFAREQEYVFIWQLHRAAFYKLPVVIHSREATDLIIGILKMVEHLHLKGIFHCFSGNAKQAQEIIDLGFFLGIGGVITFKNSGLDKVVEQIDLKHIVLETDAPYLAPVPFRGKRNEPSYILNVLKKISKIKNVSEEEVARVTSENAEKVFEI